MMCVFDNGQVIFEIRICEFFHLGLELFSKICYIENNQYYD